MAFSLFLGIVHHKKSSEINKFRSENMIIWIFGRHLGCEAKSEVAQERFSNSVVQVHKSTEKTLTGKSSFFLACTYL